MAAAAQHAGRKFVITGAGGALGGAFVITLEAAGATVSTLKYGRDYACDYAFEKFAFEDTDEALDKTLAECDVLILCHGVRSGDMAECERGNCLSQLALIERYLRCRKIGGATRPEVSRTFWSTPSCGN